MPVSLRIPSGKDEMLRKAAAKSRKTKTAYIHDAVDENLVSLGTTNKSSGSLQAGFHTKKPKN